MLKIRKIKPNSITQINKFFDTIKEEEEKINYTYNPLYQHKKNGWRRHPEFLELKQDLKKDIIQYGFSPFIPSSFRDQMENKIIYKFSLLKFYNYVKAFKKLNANVKRENFSKKLINQKKFPKTINKSNSNNLARLYNTIHGQNEFIGKKNVTSMCLTVYKKLKLNISYLRKYYFKE